MKISESQSITKNYIFKNNNVFRKANKQKHSRYKWIYYSERQIKITFKDGTSGYMLNNKFYSLRQLSHLIC